MKLSRLRHAFSLSRYQQCRRVFTTPLLALWRLAFLGKNPITLTSKNNREVTFSREAGDQLVWDWIFAHDVQFDVSFRGEICLQSGPVKCALRPNTQDFLVFREVIIDDEYRVQKQDRSWGLVVDLGANIGLFSAMMQSRAKRVVSVEAVSDNYAQALHNCLVNGGEDRNVLHRAMSDQSGQTLRIFKDSNNSGCHSIHKSWHQDGEDERFVPFEDVPTLSLADLFQFTDNQEVDYLKCDVEGAEYAIFLGCDRTLLRQIGQLALEVHVTSPDERDAPRKLADKFHSCGFQVTTNRDFVELEMGHKRSLMMFCQRKG